MFHVIRFFIDLTLDNDDTSYLHWFGAMFHNLGVGGKAIYISAFSAFAGASAMRMIFFDKERNGKLTFLFDLSRTTNAKKSVLQNRFRKSFLQSATLIFALSVYCEFISNIGVAAIIVACLVYSIWMSTTTTMIVVWSLWSIATWYSGVFCVNDIFTMPGLWLTSKIFIDTQLRQLELRLDSCRSEKISRTKFYDLLDKFYREYEKNSTRIRRFDETSRLMLWCLTSATTVLNASLLFAVLELGSTLLGYIFLFFCVVFTGGSLALLSSATSIYRKGCKIYIALNNFYVVNNNRLSIEDKQRLKQLIEDTGNEATPSISLFSAGGIPYNSFAFYGYIGAYFLTFIMFMDFLDDVFA
jgi:hypothetical protein